MSETDPVSVTVEIVNNFSDEIETLKKQLKSIERDIGVNLDIDDNGDIDWAKVELDSLEDVIDVLLDIDTKGFGEALAKKEILSKNTSSTHHLKTKLDKDLQALSGLDPPGIGSGGRSSNPGVKTDMQFGKAVGNRTLDHMEFEGISGKHHVKAARQTTKESFEKGVFEGIKDGLKKSKKSVRDWSNKVKGNFRHGFQVGKGEKQRRDSDKGFLGSLIPDGAMPGGLKNPLGKDKDGNALGIGSALKQAIPSVRMWMRLIAVLLPMVIALAAALGGLVTALVAVGTAGAAAFAFGLWGLDDLEGRINRLKSQLSSVFEPVKEVFAPFVRGFLGTLPREMQQLVEPLKELQVFEGTIQRAFRGLIGWVAKGLDEMSKFRQEIDIILNTVASATGGSIIDFFGWLVEETAKNRDTFLELAGVMKNVLATVYYLSKAISFVASNFSFLFEWLTTIAKFMNNKWVQVVMTSIVAVAGLAAALKGVILAFGLLTGGLITKAIVGLAMYIGKALVAIGVNTALAASLAIVAAKVLIIVGVFLVLLNVLDALIPGLDLVPDFLPGGSSGPSTDVGDYDVGGGGPGGPTAAGAGMGSGGGGGNTYITIEGDTDKDSLNKLNDKLDKSWQTYSSRESEREM